MKKVMVIFGTRPEATKMCTVIHELQNEKNIDVITVVTGQHKEQLQQMLEDFNITPNHDLEIMKDNQSLSYVTTSAIEGLDKLVQSTKPDMILVHGDTQSTFAGSFVAYINRIPVAHVEAGLRSHDKYSPWPEEINRKLVDVMADILFASTKGAVDNLIKEGYSRQDIFVTGQTSIDAAIYGYRREYSFSNELLRELCFDNKRLILVTAHRRENRGEPMKSMFAAIKRIADDYPDTIVVYPVHLSPVVRKIAYDVLDNHQRIKLIEPVSFLDLINLQARATIIMSDSGGLQEEASVFNKPLVLMRDTTERPEAISHGTVVLAGTGEDKIYEIASKLLSDKTYYANMQIEKNPFGDGKASKRIAQFVRHYLTNECNQPSEFEKEVEIKI